ncbi:MAG: NAD(P)/FAD-dependent oxidoreductase [Alphaproteobacteria bacterium]
MELNGFLQDEHTSGWYALLPPPPPARRLTGSERADWAVIGAGFTGLAAARRLASHLPDARIALVEADRVGFGTSGRNSGFIIDLPHHNEGTDIEDNRRLGRLVRAGLGQLRDLAGKHGIDCDWHEAGQIKAAVDDADSRVLEQFCRKMDEMGEPYRRLDRAALAAVIGSDYYRWAVHSPSVVLMQPAALVRGLAATLPENVVLFEESPIRAVREGAAVRLETSEGSLSVKGVLLASNAFTPGLGFFRRRVFPLCLYASLTRPLSDGELARLGGEPVWGVVPAGSFGATLRRTPDNRLLYRNTVRYTHDLRLGKALGRKIRANHRAGIRARYPALGEVELEHTWSGVICMSRNKGTVFGRVAPKIYASIGYNGVGVPRATASGALLADLAVGAESALLRDALALPAASRTPPLFGPALRGYLALGQWRARTRM